MADETRRRFLKWLGVLPGAAWMLGGSGCSSDEGTVAASSGDADGGAGRGGDVESGGRDAAPGGPGESGDGTSGDEGANDTSGADSGRASDSGRTDDSHSNDGDAAAEDGSAEADATADDASNDTEACEPTGSDVEGPFYQKGAPRRHVLAEEDEPGTRIVIEGTVYGPDCSTPLEEALLDVWQADANGNYHGPESNYRLRGQLQTDEKGFYRFETIQPGHYPLGGSMRPAHIHVIVSKPGYKPLTTQIYFAGDTYLFDDDPCGVCNSDDPTHIVDLGASSESGIQQAGTFDIVLER